MKNKKLPVIISACVTLALILATVLCFLIPVITNTKNSPLEISEKPSFSYINDGIYSGYYLKGKIRNKSDKLVKIKNYGGLKIYFDGSDDVADNWLDGDNIVPYIYLEPNEEFDLLQGGWYFQSSGVEVKKITVEIEGKTYVLLGSKISGLPSKLGFLFTLLALTAFIVTVAFAANIKNAAKREKAVNAMCANLGAEFTIIRGVITDKSESKKAAAKTAGWMLGATVGALFGGIGVFKVYSGTAQIDFIINDNSMYAVKGIAVRENLIPVTKENYPVESITVKKNKVIMRCADNKQSVILFADKKSGLTAEKISEILKNVLTKENDLQKIDSEAVAAVADALIEDDPFDDLKPVVDKTKNTDGDCGLKAENNADENGK